MTDLDKVIALLLWYQFSDINWEFNQCTKVEKKILGEQEMLDALKLSLIKQRAFATTSEEQDSSTVKREE